MNALNKVEIKSTFRINAVSSIEAAKVIAESNYSRRDSVAVEVILNDESAFLIVSTITDSKYYDVAFVDEISAGKFRVEVGAVSLSEVECLQLKGGDEAVNEVGFYTDGDADRVVSTEEYNTDIAHWIEYDKKEGTPGRMEGYVKSKFKKVIMVNGKFEEVSNAG